ncbi:MAG: DnaJ family molecular chaperone, partial [Candidatus Binatia bacterium]
EADGRVTADEMRFIEAVSAYLGLDPFMHAFGGFARGERFGASGAGEQAAAASRIDDALAMLGLQRGASPEDIKRAWRKLSMENHPDRAAHLGEEFRKLAGERMSQINKAYEALKEAGMAG